MSRPTIRVEGLGKQYRLGRRVEVHETIREALANGARRLARSVLRPRGTRETAETIWALRDISFEVAPGEVVGIIGPNGAGKSTLLKVLSRITEPTTGYAEVRGRVGSLIEVGTGFHPELTGRENIFLNGAILGMRHAEIRRKFDEIVAFAEVERFIDTPVKRYSSGMYVRLAFAVAAHLEPEVLFVDEVLAVGDAAFQKKCLGRMGDVARHGRTVLFVSHNLMAVENLCARVVYLENGQLVDQGPASRVISGYLSKSSASITERIWDDPHKAPGNAKIRLRRARVRPVDGTPQDAIDVRTPFVLEFDYWNFQPGVTLNLSLHVFNEQGVMVFNTAPAEDSPPLPRGLFRDVCHVPGDLMNDGMHSVELLVVKDHGTVIYRHHDLLSFEVRDTLEGRGMWYGEWAGAVRPLLSWSTTQLDAVVSSENSRIADGEAT